MRQKNLTREDISEREINTDHKGKIKLEELIESNCECVVIIGTAKVGKTMLILKTIQRYLNSENFEYIFYCNFNQHSLIKPFEKINVFDFLTSNIKYFNWMNERHTCDEVLQKIIDGQKILLIMDNFECLDLDDTKHEEIGYFNESTRENIIMNILRGFVLGGAKKIIISQPFKLEWMKMWPSVKCWRHVSVLGSNRQIQYSHSISDFYKDFVLQSLLELPIFFSINTFVLTEKISSL